MKYTNLTLSIVT